MGNPRRPLYPGGEFTIFEHYNDVRKAQKEDFCNICDYRHREGLPLYVSGKLYHLGEDILRFRWSPATVDYGRGHVVCVRQEYVRQQELAAVRTIEEPQMRLGETEDVPAVTIVELPRGSAHGRAKYILRVGDYPVQRFTNRTKAEGAERLLLKHPVLVRVLVMTEQGNGTGRLPKQP